MNHTAVFREYAQTDAWLAIHFTQWLASWCSSAAWRRCTFFGLAIAFGTAYSRWPGWLAAASGIAWIIHGLMVSFVGLFDSAPRLVALVLLAVWAFVMAVQMWPSGRRGHAARTAVPAGPVTA